VNKSVQLFKSESFVQNNLHLHVNRFVEDFNVPFHTHDFIEYCYVAEGKGFHHIESETFPVHKGQLFAIPVGVSHVFRPTSPNSTGDQLIVYNCLFDTQMIDHLSLLLHDSPIREHFSSLADGTSTYFSIIDSDNSFENIIMRLYREVSAPCMGSTTMLQTLLAQLVVAVYRQKFGEIDKPTTEAADFSRVLHYIENHLFESITLSDLASLSQWSSRHLQRMFMRHTGQSFGSYLQNCRIQRGCALLRDSDYKITVIAEQVGYRDIDSFNTIFKKIVGQTPSSYRKLYRS
jgi:AraC family L-rhamnose operon transcriptional activator RhaR